MSECPSISSVRYYRFSCIVGRYRLFPTMSNIRNVFFDPRYSLFPLRSYSIALCAIQAVNNIRSFTIAFLGQNFGF